MPHSPHDQKRVIARLRRIRGQAEALERAVASGTECGRLLQQLAALRGASTSLMTEVLEMHLHETFGSGSAAPTERAAASTSADDPAELDASIDAVMRIVRAYVK